MLPHKVGYTCVYIYICNQCTRYTNIHTHRDTVRVHNQPTDESRQGKPISQHFWQGFQRLGSTYLNWLLISASIWNYLHLMLRISSI